MIVMPDLRKRFEDYPLTTIWFTLAIWASTIVAALEGLS